MTTQIRRGLLTALISGALIGGTALASETDTNTKTTTTTVKTKHSSATHHAPADTTTSDADNTAINRRDRKDTEPTADQQKNDQTDLALTAEIRRSVMSDQTLSTNAHNIKIIADSGHVTLKGPVASAGERTTIEDKARQVAGKANVTSMIDVKP